MASVDAFNIIKNIAPEMAAEIRKVLNDPTYKNQLAQYRTKLGSLITTIQARNKNQSVIDQKYINYLNEVSGIARSNKIDISAWNVLQRTHRSNQNEMRLLLGKLYTLEHEIMSFLTNHMADTANYAIYYTSDLESGSIGRIVIKAEQLYNFLDSTGWTVRYGNIQLTYDQIQKMIENIPVESTTVDFGQVAQRVIESAKKELSDYKKELETLEEIKAQEHLGITRWKRYNALRRNVGTQTQIDLLYTKYTSGVLSAAMTAQILATTNYKSGVSALKSVSTQSLGFNRGNMAEAVERLINDPNLDIDTAIAESINNLPWYYGGDVGSTQVKGLFQENAYVNFTSIHSIVELAQELMIMLSNPDIYSQQVDVALTNQIITELQKSGAEAKLDKFLAWYPKAKIEELLKQYF